MQVALSFYARHRWVRIASYVLLAAILTALLSEMWQWVPTLHEWHPYDYELYVSWGRSLREEIVTYSYPLPTIIWIFTPLSMMPDWFVLLWASAPFFFILRMLGRQSVVLWLFFPLLVQTAFAQLDGWLIYPLLWLIQDRPFWAPLGAVLLMTKPTLAPLAILYALYRWVHRKEWRLLAQFSVTLGIFLSPAFIIDPLWLLHFLLQTSVRATESNLVPRGASIWAWWWHGGITTILLPFGIIAVLALVVYITRRQHNLVPAAEVLNLILVPFLYTSNSTMLIPLVETLPEMIALTLVSWAAVALDIIAQGWGGAYTIIPLAALLLMARRSSTPTPRAD